MSECSNFPTDFLSGLRCPVCRSALEITPALFHCRNRTCSTGFPVVRGVPILLNERNSLFSIGSYTSPEKTDAPARHPGWRDILRKLIPDISRNVSGSCNLEMFVDLLVKRSANPKVLVVGGKSAGEGFGALLARVPPMRLLETDVLFGPRTMLVCDSHDLPFEDGFFDGVIAQAVLEHVVDPYRCVEEIFRVLQPAGLVYAETPFMQQVHEGRYDFTRFTHLGHRRLFRRFEEIASGPVCGTGMALAWAYRHFLVSLSDSPTIRNFMDRFARLTSFYLKYLDDFSIRNSGSFDSASANYFIGRKSESILSDRQLIQLYRGRM